MARMARVVVPGVPHHVVQRGNRSQRVFFDEPDREFYLERLRDLSEVASMDVLAYCLMDNHTHLIVVPRAEEDLARVVGDLHQFYSRRTNFKRRWRGYLWQGRFFSCPLSDRHLYAALRYVELNPVRAGIVERPELYPWSSAGPHVLGTNDRLTRPHPLTEGIGDWREFLTTDSSPGVEDDIRSHTRTGRPLGDPDFVSELERKLGRVLQKLKPGPRPKVFDPMSASS